jgi:hypothetical protein
MARWRFTLDTAAAACDDVAGGRAAGRVVIDIVH